VVLQEAHACAAGNGASGTLVTDATATAPIAAEVKARRERVVQAL
jgi:hypothetical protein